MYLLLDEDKYNQFIELNKVTQKQQAVIKDLSENIGKPIGQAMRDAGYSESTSKTPARLTNSKAWIAVTDQYLPDQRLLEVHREGLEATVSSRSGFKDIQIPNYVVRFKYLELAYKIKHKLDPDVELKNYQMNNSDMSVHWIEDNH